MTDRDRLVKLIEDGFPTSYEVILRKDIEEIADYLLANGVTLLPALIGSTVYEIRAKGIRKYGSHRKYDYAPDTLYALNNATNQGATLYIAPKKFCKTDKVRLNKTVFLTKEKAEQALAERKK